MSSTDRRWFRVPIWRADRRVLGALSVLLFLGLFLQAIFVHIRHLSTTRSVIAQQGPTPTPTPNWGRWKNVGTSTPELSRDCGNCDYYELKLHVPAEERQRSGSQMQFVQQLDWIPNGGTYVPLYLHLVYCVGSGTGPCVTQVLHVDTDGSIGSQDSSEPVQNALCEEYCLDVITGQYRKCGLVEHHDVPQNHSLSTCVDYDPEAAATSPCFRDTDYVFRIASHVLSGMSLRSIKVYQDPDADFQFDQSENDPNCDSTDAFQLLPRRWLNIPISGNFSAGEPECLIANDDQWCFPYWFSVLP